METPWLLLWLWIGTFTLRYNCESRFNVTKVHVDEAWQSAPNGSAKCFTESVTNIGLWKYFDTGHAAPDSSGYHWLLIKLSQPVRVLSLAIMAPESTKGSRRVEIFLSDTLTTGVLNATTSCHADISHNKINLWKKCGKTDASENAALRQEVNCNYSDIPMISSFIMLRKSVQTEEPLTLQWIEIVKESDFFSCDGFTPAVLSKFNSSIQNGKFTNESGCSNLNNLMFNRKHFLIIALSPTIKKVINKTSCLLRSPDGRQETIVTKVRRYSDLFFLIEFSGNTTMHLWSLQCIYTFIDGQQIYASDTLGFISDPKVIIQTDNFKISIHGSLYWLAEKYTEFSFITDSVFMKPEHSCYLTNREKIINSCALIGYKFPVTRSYPDVGNRPSCPLCIKYTTMYSLLINSSFMHCSIACTSRLKDRAETFTTVDEIRAPFVHPCKTQFTVPTDISWQHGTSVNVTVDSSESNWPFGTRHSCMLQTDSGNNSLNAANQLPISNGTSNTSVFTIEVMKNQTNASILCLVNQSGLCETWRRSDPVPIVRYQSVLNIQVESNQTCAGSKKSLSIQEQDPGYPTPDYNCTISGRYFNRSLLENFQPMAEDHGRRISCRVVQTETNGGVAFEQQVNSTALNVIYPAKNSWSATQRLVVKEGEPLTVNLSFHGGNPDSTAHQCWIKTKNGLQLNASSSYPVGNLTASIRSFTFSAQKCMNDSLLICNATHECGVQSFNESIIVFYEANVSITLVATKVCKDSNVSVEVNVVDPGYPIAVHNCSISGRYISNETRIQFKPDDLLGPHRISCLVTQTDFQNGLVYSKQVNSTEILDVFDKPKSSWTAVQPIGIKESDILSVNVTSLNGEPNSTHNCWVNLKDGSRIPMSKAQSNNSAAMRSSTFSVVSNRSMNASTLFCDVLHNCGNESFNQSVVVFQKAKMSVNLGSTEVCMETNVTVHVTINDPGYPVAAVTCSISGRRIGSSTTIQNAGLQFKPFINESNHHISCTITQRLSVNKTVIFTQQVNSTKMLIVNYPPDKFRTENNSLEVTEGDLLTVYVFSSGGRPEPAHMCWVKKLKKLENITGNASTVNNSQFQSKFTVKSQRWMNGGQLVCKMTHMCATKSFTKNITVFYPTNVTFNLIFYNSTHLIININVSDGIPRPTSVLRVASRDPQPLNHRALSTNLSTSNEVNLYELSVARTECSPEELIFCQINQSVGDKIYWTELYNFSCNVTASGNLLKIAASTPSPGSYVLPTRILYAVILVALVLAGALATVAIICIRRCKKKVQRPTASAAALAPPIVLSQQQPPPSTKVQGVFVENQCLYQENSERIYSVVFKTPKVQSNPALARTDSNQTIYIEIIGDLPID